MLCLPLRVAGAAPSTGRWLLLSDIHFTPYADTRVVDALVAAPVPEWRRILSAANSPPSAYGTDTNYALLASSLDEMKRVEPEPPVVVIAGDFLAHGFPESFGKLEPGQSPSAYQAFVDKTIAFIAAEVNARFPHAQFIVVLGNNDGYCGDYRSTPASPFLAHFATSWGPMVNRNGAAPDFARTFPLGGYYVATLPLRVPAEIVALNSVFWSIAYENACGSPTDRPGAAEVAWLREATQTAVAARWFVAHIPPTLDAYDSMRTHVPVSFLRDRDADDAISAMTATSARTAAIILGHTHHPSFAVFGGGLDARPGIIVGSISPVQGNNPSFATADVDPNTGTITDMSTYALLLESSTPVWTREFDFDSLYGVARLDGPSLQQTQTALGTDAHRRAAFAAYYTSSSLHGGIDPATWAWYWCANAEMTSTTYATCVARGGT